MKVKVKGLVFAGLAAVIFAGNAMAAAGDLDPAVNPTHVTAKSYVDRVVNTRHPLIDSEHKLSAELVDGALTSADMTAYDSHIGNNDIHVTASQKTDWQAATDAVNNATTGLDQRQLKSESTAVAGNYILAGTNVGENLKRLDEHVYANETAITTINSNIGTVPAGSTVMDEIAAAQAEATYNDTALAGRVTTIEGYSSAYTSGIDATKVAQIATNASNITALQNDKEDKNNKTTTGLITTDGNGNITAVAAGTADAYASTSAISSDLTKVKNAITAANGVASGLDDRLTTAEGEIDALQAADETLQDNIDGKQDKSTADYQMGNSSGTWTAMTSAQQNALNSGIVASTCSANAPCAWINNAWVPIQQ